MNFFVPLLDAMYRVLPPHIRRLAKTIIGVHGHKTSYFDALRAARLARGKKRLDAALAALLLNLEISGLKNLRGRTCLKVGTGLVPTDALCMYLLGATRVVSTDLNRIAQFDKLPAAIGGILPHLQTSALLGLAGVPDFHERLSRVLGQRKIDEEFLASLGITYIAPFNIAYDDYRLGDSRFDFIYSISVLEHLPPEHCATLLSGFSERLSDSGIMIHDVDLQDHFDAKKSPFRFLLRDAHYDAVIDCDERGNSLRCSDWARIFSRLGNLDTTLVPLALRDDCRPPRSSLRSEYAERSDEDLFTSRVLSISKRRAAEVGGHHEG